MQYALWKYPIHFLAYGFGAGLVTPISGLLGALIGAGLFRFLSRLKGLAYAFVTGALFLAGVYVCGQTAHDIGAHDPGTIVFDEIMGFLVAMYRLPARLEWVVAGLVVFVTLDVWKPWPIYLFEAIPHTGTAIMADDLVAGLFTLVILHLMRRLLVQRNQPTESE